MSAASAVAISSNTPILDRVVPPPPPAALPRVRRKVTRGFILAAVFVGLAGFAAFLTLLAQPRFSFALVRQWGSVTWHLVEPLLAFCGAVAVHELGHTIAGKLVGLRFALMRLGPFHITLPLRVRWQCENPLPGAVGFVVMMPKDTSYLRARYIFMLLGGSVANLASCAILLAPYDRLLLGWFALASLFMGIVNLIPTRYRALASDGRLILTLLFHSRQGNRWLALIRLRADLRNGVAPEDLNVEFIKMAIAVEDSSSATVTAHSIAYERAFYKEDAAEAARLLEVCLKYSNFTSPLGREMIFTDAATFQATRRKRIDLARQWMQDLPEKCVIPGRRLWIEAAILEVQGDIQGTLKKLSEVEEEMMSLKTPELRKAALKPLQRWRAELQGKATAN